MVELKGYLNVISKLLKKEMTKQKLTYASLSRKADMNPQTVKKALNGDAKLSVYQEIAKSLGKKITWVVEQL